MKRHFLLAATCIALLGLAWMAGTTVTSVAAQSAAVQAEGAETKTFAIRNMTCALCPVTVKKAMQGVTGVKLVSIDFDAKTATVVFDPSVTDASAIAAAATNAGYPATVKG